MCGEWGMGIGNKSDEFEKRRLVVRPRLSRQVHSQSCNVASQGMLLRKTRLIVTVRSGHSITAIIS